jgi:recombination protein RecA
MGVELDVIQKSGAWYAYKGTKIAQGREAAKLFVEDNPEVAAEMEAIIRDKIATVAPTFEPVGDDED